MNRTPSYLCLAALLLAAAVPSARAASAYDKTILADRPVMFLSMDTPGTGTQTDLSGGGRHGRYVGGTPATVTMPNGDKAASFNGAGQHLSVPSHAALSVPTARALTIESWIRPSTLQFPRSEAEGYVYWLGKGDPTNGYEYANRMYSKSNSVNRPNRISVYQWNKSGGLGSGSYIQDPVSTSQWILITDVIDMRTATVSIYKNGVLRMTTPLSQYKVTPATTNAPFKVGTRNGSSWFQGAVGKVAVYNYVLSASQIANHYKAMTAAPAPSPSPTPSPTGAPVASAVQASNVTGTSAAVLWRTDRVSHSQVEYGLTTAYGAHSVRSTDTGLYHKSTLSSLQPGRLYHYRVKSLDPVTKLTGVSKDFTFTTPSAAGAPVVVAGAPVASAVQASNVTGTSAAILWRTDKVSHSQVEFGLTTAYGAHSVRSTDTGLYHKSTLSSLQPGKVYHYRVKSFDPVTKLTGVSKDFTFTTPGAAAPVASAVQASNVTATSAAILWRTDKVSHSQVEYGLTTAYGAHSVRSMDTGLYHKSTLSNLQPGKVYHYRVKSFDPATGRTGVSGDFTLKTSGTTTASL